MKKIKKIIKKRLKLFINSLNINNHSFNKRVFTKIYEKDLFNERSNNTNNVSKSGSGSDLEQTKEIVEKLPILLKKYEIKSMLDIPCGDFYWMKNVDLNSINYTGADIVEKVINENNVKFSTSSITFKEIDILTQPLPKVDLIFCRDLLVHLKNKQISLALKNIQKSGSKYLLTTSFKNTTVNIDNGEIGIWRPINLEIEPFNLKNPIDYIFENCTEKNGKYIDKYLLLYRLN